MSMTELAGALFLAFFASNSVLTRSAGLDSAERFSRTPHRTLAFAAAITLSAIAADSISFLVLHDVLPIFGIGASTLLDGVVIVLSALVTAVTAEIIVRRFVPQFLKLLGGEVFSVGYNSSVTGIVLLCHANAAELDKSIIYCLIFSASVVIMYAAISVWRLDIKEHKLPGAFRGAPILFILLGLAAMVMQGYAGASLPG